MKKTLIWLILVIWIPCFSSMWAADNVYVQYLDNRDGLPNNTVRTIFQDSKGFIWMSTLNGISRYDGYSFTNYFPESGSGISLADRRVKSIHEDSHGFLWFTTSADMVSCFDLRKNRFVDFTGNGEYRQNYGYYQIFPEAVWLWGRHNGARLITYKDREFISQTFTTRNRKLRSDYVFFLKKDDTGTVWIGTKKGLYRYASGQLKCMDASDGFNTVQVLPDNRVAFLTDRQQLMVFDGHRLSHVADLSLLMQGSKASGGLILRNEWLMFTENGTIGIDIHTFKARRMSGTLDITGAQSFIDTKGIGWVYSRNGQLLMVSPKTGAVKSFMTTSSFQARFSNNERYHVTYDQSGVAWIVSNLSGLYSYDPHTGYFRHYDESDGRFPLVTSNAVQSILIDRSGGFWIGSENTGVAHFRFVNDRASYFMLSGVVSGDLGSNSVRLADVLPDGSIFIGTRDGNLYTYNSSLTRLTEKETFGKNIYALCRDNNGVIWKASRGEGLFIGNKQYRHNSHDANSLAFDQLFCLTKDRKGRIWIGTLGRGLDLAVSDGKGGYTFRHFFNKTYAQSNVRALMEDRNGWIWVGTSDGLYVFRPDEFLKNGRFYHYFPNVEIKQLKEDSKGNVYIAESGVGVALSRKERDYARLKLEHFGVGDGLINTMVQAFVEDKQGHMWMTTENGVTCFDLQKKTFDNYFFSSDMKKNVYNESAAFLFPDGRLAFGTNYGLQLIDPTQLRSSSRKSSVVFTNLKLNGIEDSPLDESLAYSTAIRLDYDQNSFVVNFSTLDYPISIMPQYSYLLENYDSDWSTPSTLNFVGYKNLDPGTYKLRVKVRNASGVWSNESVLTIVITPPFWRTPWAYLVYILLLAGAGYATYRIIRNMNELRNKIKLEKQLTDYKLVFFTNISHEFRTPLTLIQATLDRLHRMRLTSEVNTSVRMIARSTNRLMRLVNQLMDFRKMEKGKLRPALEKVDVVMFIGEICRSFNDRAAMKHMKFVYESKVASRQMYIDKEKMDKIVYNLLSNAFKYTPVEGSVACRVSVDPDDKFLEIQVSDSGVGIPKEKEKELFGRFMQSNFSGNSMGIGLHLTYELVHVLKGTIFYRDNPGGGAVFTVSLPMDESVYAPEDFLSSNSVLLKEEDRQRQDIAEIETGSDTMECKSTATNSVTASTVGSEREIISSDSHSITNGKGIDATAAGSEFSQTENSRSNTGKDSEPMNNRHLLVIEDDDDVRGLLKDELSAYFEVTTKADGESGIAYAVENDVDLIVCDVMMPGLSGFEVTKRLKTNFETSHIPIILLTALGDSDNYLEGIESGADAYVTKPFSVNLLLARISHLIEQRDKLREKFSKDPINVRPIICTTNEDKKFSDKLLVVIEAHLKDGEFSADDFASEMALGRTVFYKKVKGITGYSPKEYIRIIRMKRAAKLLLEPNVTVAEVAYDVGMNDPFYFSRCFKTQFGISPSFYQKNGGVIPDKVTKEDDTDENPSEN